MSGVIAVVVLVLSSMCNCVIFPGPCPKSAPTHLPPDEALEGKMAFGAPFERPNSSNLFIGQPFNMLKVAYDYDQINITYSAWKITVQIMTPSNDTPFGTRLARTIVWEWGTSVYQDYLKNMEIYMPCFRTKSEVIKMWFEDQMGIVWSCAEISDSEHDEAILALSFKKIVYGEELSTLANKFNEMAKKYLNTSRVMEKVDWKWAPDQYFYDKIACPPQLKIKPQLKWVFIGLIVVIIAMILVSYIEDMTKLCKKINK